MKSTLRRRALAAYAHPIARFWHIATLGALLIGLVSTLLLAQSVDAAKQPAPLLLAHTQRNLITVVGPSTRLWLGHGVDGRWSNPANWQNGVIPAAADIVRFPANQGSEGGSVQTLVDSNFAGRIAGLILDPGYAGTVRLARDLVVDGDIVIGGGIIQQGGYQLATNGFRQAGGQFVGGSAPLTIRGAASLQDGIFDTPASTMNVATLDIQAPAVMRLAANAKLNITGDGAVLTGSGLLDTMTHRPNSVELTGQATSDLMSVGPMQSYSTTVAQNLPSDLRSAVQNAAPSAQGASLPLTDEFNFWSAVIDTEQGFAYFGTWTKPGTIVKVRLSTFTRVGALVLNAGENGLRSAVIDATNGYAYFGAYTAPGKVVQINLRTFTRESVLTFPQGDNNLTAAVIDPLKKLAYFGTDTKPGRVIKVNLANFTRVGAIPLPTGEDFLKSAVIDSKEGFAYFGTDTTPGNVVKINLTNFTRENALKLDPGNEFLISAVIDTPPGDTAPGFAYFGTDTAPGKVIKVSLNNFVVENVLTLNPTDASLASAVIDPKNGFAYFGTRTKPGLVVTVKLENFTRINAQQMSNPNEDYLTAAVINPVNGFVYFATGFESADTQYTQFNKPGVIIRLATTTAFAQSASLQFPGEDKLVSSVIDEAGGFAYFGADTTPGVVVKVRTADNTRVAALTLLPGEDRLSSAVIDAQKGFAYFGTDAVTDTVPSRVVKIKLSNFTRDAALTLNAQESGLRTAVIDVGAGFAYFGTAFDPARIVKIKLSDFTRVTALTLNPGDTDVAVAMIDSKNGFAYFGTDSQPGQVIRIKLSPFARDSALTLEPGENNLAAAVIDTSSEVSFAYVGTRTSPGIVVKLKLNDFTRDSALQLSGQGFERLVSAVINPAADRAYFGTAPQSGNGNGRVIGVQLSDLTQAGSVELNTGEDPLRTAVIDAAAGVAFFGVSSEPGSVVKVQLDPLTRVSGLRLSAAAFNFWSAVIDPANGFAYFGTWTQPGRVAKVRLADFSNVGVLSLAPGEDGLRSAVIDPTNGFAYFGTYTTPGKVVKINLADFTRAAVLPLANGDDNLTAAVIDPAQGQAYFGTDTAPGTVVKIDLATFTRAAGIPLNSGEDFLQSAVIDLLTGNAYFGAFTTPGKVVKISLATFSRVNNLTLNAGEDFLTAAIIDPAKGFAYFGTWTTPGRVIKIKLQGLTRESANTFGANEARFTSAVIDATSGLGYFGTQTQPGRVVKVNLETLALIDTLDMQNPKEDFLTAAVIDPANNVAYFGAGFDEADLLYQRFNTPGIVMKIGLNPRVDTKKSTATVIAASPNPSEVGQNVNFIVTVTGDGGTPTGTITFYHHGSIGNGALSGGVATFNTTTIPTETHIITATYNGDGNFVVSTAAPFEHRVNQPNREGSKITVVADPNPSESGQQVKFTATVAPLAGVGGPPTGQVQFYVGNEKMGSPRTLTNGVATTAYNKLVEVRLYAISAKYLGDSKYTGSDANVLNQEVKPASQVVKTDTTVALTATPNPAAAGQTVTFRATVTAGASKPAGTVTFLEGTTTLGVATLDANAVATLNLSTLAAGAHTLTARYEGDSNFNASTSPQVPLTIQSSTTEKKSYLPLIHEQGKP